jgi:hypothetical protein
MNMTHETHPKQRQAPKWLIAGTEIKDKLGRILQKVSERPSMEST